MEFVLFLALLLYLVPWLVAEAIEHPRRHWILALDLALGWTGIGWLAAFLWAWRGRSRPKKRAQLVLVSAAAPRPVPMSSRCLALRSCLRLYGGPALAGVALVVASLSVALQAPRRLEMKGEVDLAVPRAVLRMGPDERWQSVGEIDSPCRLRLLERKGPWRRVLRGEPCAGSMPGHLGWIHVSALGPARDP